MPPHPIPHAGQPDLAFAPGVSIWLEEPGVLIVVDAAESFARLTLPPADAERMLAGRFADLSSARAAEGLAALRAEGYVVPAVPEALASVVIDAPCPGPAVEPLRGALQRLLSCEDSVPVWPGTPEQVVILATASPDPAAVTECAQRHGCAPLPVSAEGGCVVIGPWPQPFETLPASPAGRPDAVDLRDRRLAAHPAPEMLAALWNPPADARLAHPTPEVCLLAAAWLRNALHRTPELLQHTQTLVSTTGEITHHRVLPVPRHDGPHPARPDELPAVNPDEPRPARPDRLTAASADRTLARPQGCSE